MRCPSCNKFPAFDSSTEPEVSIDECSIELHDGSETEGIATVTGTVRIVLTTECCGDEAKEANFDLSQDIEVTKAADCVCIGLAWCSDAANADGDGPEMTDRREMTRDKTYVRGPNKGKTVKIPIPSRFQKQFYGADVPIVVNCPCGKEIGKYTWSDDIQASHMDELG